MKEQLGKNSSGDHLSELSLYGPPQHEFPRLNDDERIVYGSPQHEVTDTKPVESSFLEPRLRKRLFPSSNVPERN